MGYILATVNALYDDEVDAGRVLTVTEFIDRLRGRPDIFGKENGTMIGKIELVCLVSAIITGYLLSSYKPDLAKLIDIDFLEPDVHDITSAIVIPGVIERPKPVVKTPPEVSSRKTLTKKTVTGDNRSSGRAAGTPTESVAKKGIFALIGQAQLKGADASFSEITAKGGFSETIDAVIAGIGGLKQGNSFSSGRIGVSSIGFGKGYGLTGNGDGAGDVGDLIGAYQSASNVELQHIVKDVKSSFEPHTGGYRIGGRSRSSVMSVVLQNLPVLRHIYNNRLRSKPGLRGKITVRFAIDEFGNVLHCDIIESTMSDGDLEKMVVGKVRSWRFDKIDKPGDITEIVYPFVFSAG